MTNWAQSGWCDLCEQTLVNGGAGDGVVCPDCGFDTGKAESERKKLQEEADGA